MPYYIIKILEGDYVDSSGHCIKCIRFDRKSELLKSFWQILSRELFSSCVFLLRSTYKMVSSCMKSRTIRIQK